MNSSDVRNKYLKFFEKKGHKILPSSSLVPENDPTTLFTGSGMQPMVPYLLGETHPEGKRLADSQKCFRSQDIEEVGDNRHDTFFEMLGNWSLGDYFKKEQLEWLWEFLTEQLKLDPQKLYVTAFIGDSEKNIPKDTESAQIWKGLFAKKGIDAKEVEIGSEQNGYEKGMQDGRIFYYDASKNWWSRSGTPEKMPANEPGGPDSEVFYDFGIDHNPEYGQNCHPNCDCGRFLEIGNSVFMQYQKQEDGSFKELPQKNVDFGGGLERLLMAVNNEQDMFKNDLHWPIIEKICEYLDISYEHDHITKTALRIIADHIKASVFLIKDGVLPSNKQQGYVLRRLLRRSAVKTHYLKPESMDILSKLVDPVIDIYEGTDYFQVGDWDNIRLVIEEEINKFKKTLYKGLKEVEKIDQIDGKKAFDLYQTFGFPLELTAELFSDKGQKINLAEFEAEFKKHQDLSRTTSAGTFKGGLADASEKTTKLHTANHLLQAALRQILGEHVRQRGSNITAERLRFDFTHPAKVTEEELKKAEELVNQKIQEDLQVWFDIEDKQEAIQKGALTNYGENYPDKVKVYKMAPVIPSDVGVEGSLDKSVNGGDLTQISPLPSVGRNDNLEKPFSMELCGGPHVEHTGVLNSFKILKEESASAGIRRIYATVE